MKALSLFGVVGFFYEGTWILLRNLDDDTKSSDKNGERKDVNGPKNPSRHSRMTDKQY